VLSGRALALFDVIVGSWLVASDWLSGRCSRRLPPRFVHEPLEFVTASRTCGGTPTRLAYSFLTQEVNPKLDYYEKTNHVPADAGINGCGHALQISTVPATDPPAKGLRPLFAKTGKVYVCPSCDGPSQ
jgi:hypothetical protein